MGQETMVYVTFTEPADTDLWTANPTSVVKFVYAVPYNSTVEDCYVDEIMASSITNTATAGTPTTQYTIAFTPTSAGFSPILTMMCKFQFPPGVASSLQGGGAASFKIIVQNGEDVAYNTGGTYPFTYPENTGLTTIPATYTGGKGTSSYFSFSIATLPFKIYHADRVQVSSGAFSTSIGLSSLRCDVLGAPLTVVTATTGGVTMIAPVDIVPSDDSYFRCAVIVPVSGSGTTLTFTIAAAKFPSTDGEPTYAKRYSFSVAVPAPVESVIGALSTQTYMETYPKYFVAGLQYSAMFLSDQFNTALQYRTQATPGDTSEMVVYAGQIRIAMPLGQGLKRIADTSPVCTYTMDTTNPPSFANPLFVTTTTAAPSQTINGQTVDYIYLRLVPREDGITSSEFAGHAFRIYCNGFELASTSYSLPWTNPAPVSIQVYSEVAKPAENNNYGTIMAQATNIQWNPLVVNSGSTAGEDVTYLLQTLSLPTTKLFTYQQIERILEIYKEVIGIPNQITIYFHQQRVDGDKIIFTISFYENTQYSAAALKAMVTQAKISSVFNQIHAEFGFTSKTFQSGPEVLTMPGTCSNGVLDDGETDVDCGGADCTPCTASYSCTNNADCQSGNCNNKGLCQMLSENGASGHAGSVVALVTVAVATILAVVVQVF